jgi:hypothetical protein
MLIPMVQLIKFSVISGMTMSAVAMALGMVGFTTLDLGTYLGCLLTGEKSGLISFVAGLAAHLIASVVIAYFYLQAMTYFNMPLSLKTACILGLMNTFCSGIMIKAIDMIHPCVASKKLQGIGLFASGYGMPGIITYALIHLVFAATFLKLLGAPFTL